MRKLGPRGINYLHTFPRWPKKKGVDWDLNPFDSCHHKLWEVLKEMGIPDHLTCLLRNLYVGQEATVRTGHGTTPWFQLVPSWERSASRLYVLPCLFNLYAEYIMRNTGLEETQAGIKISRRNINNLRYADYTTLMAESVKGT